MLILGFLGGGPPTTRSNYLLIKGIEAIGVRIGGLNEAHPEMPPPSQKALVELAGQGKLKPPRDELVQTVLRREFSPFDRSIDTHVSNLRRKLGPAADGGERIKGVRGIGYQYALDERDRPRER